MQSEFTPLSQHELETVIGPSNLLPLHLAEREAAYNLPSSFSQTQQCCHLQHGKKFLHKNPLKIACVAYPALTR